MDKSRFWFIPLVFLCLVQFGAMADDSAFANSLSAITLSLHATVAEMQFANMIYSLMAGSVMIAAGLLGAKIGLKRLLLIGLLIIGIAELIVAMSPNIFVLVYIGRVLAGLGGSLCVPALIGLISTIYTGRQLAISYGCLGATTAVGSSIAPILSGLIIVYLNWRLSFLALAILFFLGMVGSIATIPNTPPEKVTPSFDKIGFVLLFVGFTTLMFGISHVTNWGFYYPMSAPFTIAGISPVPFLIVASLAILVLFWFYENMIEKKYGMDAVLLPSMFLKDASVRGGIMMSAYVFYILGGLMFSIVIFMQIVLNESPLVSGLYIAIFSLGMSITSILVPIVATKYSPRLLCQVGIATSSFATLLIIMGLEANGVNNLFYVGLFLIGFGLGIVASQCNLAVVSAIKDPALANKSSGVQGAARNIGESCGIAIIGIMIMLGLTASIKNHVDNQSFVPESIQAQVRLSHSIPFMSNAELRAYLSKNNVDKSASDQLLVINENGRLHAMRVTLLMMCLSGFLFIFATRKMVNRPIRELSQS